MIEIYDENYEIWYAAELVHLDFEAAAPLAFLKFRYSGINHLIFIFAPRGVRIFNLFCFNYKRVSTFGNWELIFAQKLSSLSWKCASTPMVVPDLKLHGKPRRPHNIRPASQHQVGGSFPVCLPSSTVSVSGRFNSLALDERTSPYSSLEISRWNCES